MSTVVIGYLGSPYAEIDYGAGLVQENLASQSLVTITKEQDLAAQVLATIVRDKNVAAQALLQLTKDKQLGSQADITRTESDTLGSQSLVTVTPEPTHAAAESLVTRTESTHLASQSSIERTEPHYLAAQSHATIIEVEQLGAQGYVERTESTHLAAQSDLTRTENAQLGAQALSSILEQTQIGAQSLVTQIQTASLAAQANITKVVSHPLAAQANADIVGATRTMGAEGGISPYRQVPCDVYLSGGYLSGPYLQPCQEVYMPAQAFVSRREAENLAAQSLLTITRNVHLGAQANAIITTYKQLGAQAMLRQVERLAAQARIVIYNTTNLRILSDFANRGTDGLTWTASSTEPGDFDVNNLNTDIVEQYWRTATGVTTSVTLICDTQLAQGVFVDTIGILNHNLSGAATCFVDGSDDPGFTTVETVQINIENTNSYYIAPELPLNSYRYWRFRLNDPGSADGFIRIGTIVFGSAIIFAGECYTDNVRLGRQQFVDQVFTEGFTNVKNDRGQKKNLGLEFRQLNYNKQNYRNLRDLIETQGTILKCLWIPTPKYPSRFALFGKLTELPTETHNDRGNLHDYIDLSISVDEAQ